MLFLASLIIIFLDSYLEVISPSLHQLCLNFSPPGKHIELYQGIVCGKSLRSTETLSLFATSGLLHILVVSGSHLLFLYKTGEWLRLPHKALLLICYIYSFTCLLEPPIVRAYIFLSLYFLNTQYRFQWSVWHKHALTIGLCLLIYPTWVNSLSFQLSLLCGFALSLPYRPKEVWIFLILSPALVVLGNANPFSIVFNILLGPVLGCVLFPLSILCFFFPSFSFVIDYIWDYLLLLLEWSTSSLQAERSFGVQRSNEVFWLYIFSLWLLGVRKHYVSIYHRLHTHT